MLSEVAKARAHAQLADLAPTLRERELRVLLALTNAFAGTEHESGRLSAAQLVKLTGLSRSNVFLAIASLRDRHMIATRGGTATEASGYKLTFTRATPIKRSPTLGPPPVSKQDQGDLTTGLQVDLFQDQGGPAPGPSDPSPAWPRDTVIRTLGYNPEETGMTTEEKLERLTGIVETLAPAVAAHDTSIEAHDRQIEALITVAEKQDTRLRTLITMAEKHEKAIEDMSKQWQAYLNTLPRQ